MRGKLGNIRTADAIGGGFILLLCTLLGGCSAAKGPWYDPFLIMTPILTPTQEYTGNNRVVSADPTSMRPTPGGVRINSPQNQVQLIKLSLPLGTFSGNDAVWRQLDEDVLDSDTSIMLAENGIRAAVAPQDRWPALSKLINVQGAMNEKFILQTDGRSSIEIITHPNIPGQTVSSIDRDRELHVRSFDRCDNSIRLSLSRKRNSTDLSIQLEPVVQIGTITVNRNPMDAGIIRTTVPQEETFANLRLAVSLQPNQFLVLSPANTKVSKFSVGSRFLTDTDKVPPMETILIFLPGPNNPSSSGPKAGTGVTKPPK